MLKYKSCLDMFNVEQVLWGYSYTQPKGNISMNQDVPCQSECLRRSWCDDNGCAKTNILINDRHDQESDDYICPEDITCESREACDIVGLCRKQLMHPTQTEWYKRILRLRVIIDDYQIWLFSDDISDQCIVEQWIRCRVEPNPREKLRMLCAEKWLKYVAKRKGSSFARIWFKGDNFDGFPAYVALREDRYHLLEESARECTESINF